MSSPETQIGPLQLFSDAAARALGYKTDEWQGYEFAAVPGEGIWVTGRRGKSGEPKRTFVTLEQADAR